MNSATTSPSGKEQKGKPTKNQLMNNPAFLASLWSHCLQLSIRSINGNKQAFLQLEDISKNEDIVCLGYYVTLLRSCPELYDEKKYRQYGLNLHRKVSNTHPTPLPANFLTSFTNQHEQLIYGTLFEYGIGVCLNPESAFVLTKQSADQGHIIAQHKVGCYYLQGFGVPKDDSLSYQSLLLSAQQGFSFSQFIHGLQLLNGTNVTPINEQEAIEWIRLAANQGHLNALTVLASMYHYGRVVPRDRNESINLYEKAAEGGIKDAKFQLALHYLRDSNDPINHQRGFNYLTEMNSNPQLPNEIPYSLAVCYEYGIGVKREEVDAFNLYFEVTNRGSHPGSYALGRFFEEGIGIESDLERSRSYFDVAVERGNLDAKTRLVNFEEDKVGMTMKGINNVRYKTQRKR